MEASILTSTKKKLGLAESYTVFDEDIITFVNSTFSSLSQLGVGPDGGFMIEDELEEWADLGLPDEQLNMVKTYIFLKAKLMFDPPATSFTQELLSKQILEHEWRLNVMREGVLHPFPTDEVV